jgi:hypothetical protein
MWRVLNVPRYLEFLQFIPVREDDTVVSELFDLLMAHRESVNHAAIRYALAVHYEFEAQDMEKIRQLLKIVHPAGVGLEVRRTQDIAGPFPEDFRLNLPVVSRGAPVATFASTVRQIYANTGVPLFLSRTA